MAAILQDAERRDVSQLTLIADAAYHRGLAHLRAIVAADPNAQVPVESALVYCTARRISESKGRGDGTK